MATLRKLVSDVRSMHKLISTDGLITDRAIASEIKNNTILLVKRETNMRRLWSTDTLFTTIPCLEMVQVAISECCDYTDPCTISRSKYKLPKVMSTRNKLAIKAITTIQGKSLYETTPTKDEYKKYTNTKKEGLFYFIHNGYLFVTGSTTLKVVTFTAIFENPLDLAGINACDPDGNNLPGVCFDPKSQDFPIDEDLFDDIEDMALEKLVKVMARMPNDSENNARDAQVVNDLE
jgi:hypothetical protein